jgi:integrase
VAKDPYYKRCKCRDEEGKDLGPDCPKLRRADGSWNPKHGTWYFGLELPRGPGGKRRPRMRRGGFESRDAAQAAYDEAKAMIRRGGDPANRELAGDYLRKWLDERIDLKATARRTYGITVNTYLIPLLGHVEMTQLQADDVGKVFATIREWNDSLAAGKPVRPHQRHVGPEAMQRIRAVLRAALNDAVDDGILGFNPAMRKRVRMETVRKWKPLAWTPAREAVFWKAYRDRLSKDTTTRGDRAYLVWRNMDLRPVPAMVWTPDQAGKFLAYATGHRLCDMFELIMLTAIRRGEACGLARDHVDLDASELLVGAERVQVGWEVVQQDPKSEAGWRPIALDDREKALLRKISAGQAEERLAWGDDWQETGLVFTVEDGRPVHPDAVSDTFGRLAFAAGLPPVRVHDLRHAWASYALSGGISPAVVQQRLGHSTIKLTLDTYTTVLNDLARTAAKTVGDIIPARPADGTPGQKDSIGTPLRLVAGDTKRRQTRNA